MPQPGRFSLIPLKAYQLAVPFPEIGMALPRKVGFGFAIHWNTALHLAMYSLTFWSLDLLIVEVLHGTPMG